jgi:hypothetical protein
MAFNGSSQLLGAIERFVEPTPRHKGVATQNETAGCRPARNDQDWHSSLAPTAQSRRIRWHHTGRAATQSLDGRATTASFTMVSRVTRWANHPRLSSAGIAGRRDLAVSDMTSAAPWRSTMTAVDPSMRHRRLPVRRVRLQPDLPRAGVRRNSEQTLLVVGRDNERDHQVSDCQRRTIGQGLRRAATLTRTVVHGLPPNHMESLLEGQGLSTG